MLEAWNTYWLKDIIPQNRRTQANLNALEEEQIRQKAPIEAYNKQALVEVHNKQKAPIEAPDAQ